MKKAQSIPNQDTAEESHESEERPNSELERLKKQVDELAKARDDAEAANLAKSEFLANMSHDLRTPLHSILSYSRFGVEKIDRITREKTVKYFSNIEESGKKLEVMLSKIVDLSKLESGRMVFQVYSCNVSLIIKSLSKDFKLKLDEKKLKLQVQVPEDVPLVSCDQNMIARSMHILLQNAVNNAMEETDIIVSIEPYSMGQIEKKSALKISFCNYQQNPLDDEIVLDFEYYQNKTLVSSIKGNDGIDLAIAFKIIKQHGGLLWAENKSSGLVCYSFSLPVITER